MKSRIFIVVFFSLMMNSWAGTVTRIYNLGRLNHLNQWFGSNFNTDPVHNNKLFVGTWFEQRYSLLWFEDYGLVDNPQKVELMLYELLQAGGWRRTPVNFDFWQLTSSWNGGTGYYNNLYGYFLGRVVTPSMKSGWVSIDITETYKSWKRGEDWNNGFYLAPGEFDLDHYEFASCEHKTQAYRPRLKITYDPADVAMKLPLPGGKSWVVTTSAGDPTDKYHRGTNYYSIDFASNDASLTNIEIKASAGGKVVASGFDEYNGNYVVVDHDYDGNVSTGIQTRYLHMDTNPTAYVVKGDIVSQGDQLGIMGDTGISDGVHLHFGVRYKNNGSASIPALINLLLDGNSMSSYKVGSLYYSTNSP